MFPIATFYVGHFFILGLCNHDYGAYSIMN